MVGLIIKKYIKRHEDATDPGVRRRLGVVCGAAGIVLNALLCAIKLAAGYISGAISITADGLNNLSDAFSSAVELAGFRLSGKQPDSEHPYGHGRMEYIAGLLVAVLILTMGVELIRSAITRIQRPEPVEFSYLIVGMLVFSILVKLYMAVYNRKYARLIDSEVMRATAIDSRNDMIATFAVLATVLASRLTSVQADGWCALAVGLFVLASGVRATARTISTILGKPPGAEYTERIRSITLSNPEVLGVHDIVVHDYGPGRAMVSLHAEMPASEALLSAHATIDRIEAQLARELGCEAVIHIDPKRVEDKPTADARRLVSGVLYAMDPGIGMHDFQLRAEGDERALSFDIVAPYALKYTDDEIRERLENALRLTLDMPINIRIDRG